MLNYTVHAMESMTGILQEGGFASYPATERAIEEIVTLLDKAVKFELPDNGAIIDREKSLEVLDPELLHLPFPVVALEYAYTDESNIPDGSIAVPKRIALCFEYESNANYLLSNSALRSHPSLAMVGGIVVIPVMFFQGMWVPASWGCVIPREDAATVLVSRVAFGHRDHPSFSRVGMTVMPVMLEACQGLIDQVGASHSEENGLKDSLDEVLAAVTLMAALSCSNVGLQDVPAPDKLNKKRLKSGKLPLYGYKSVVVLTAQAGFGNEDLGGHEQRGVRSHLRRGHIRRLGDNRRIWIQSTIVNAGKGLLDQSYRFAKKSSP